MRLIFIFILAALLATPALAASQGQPETHGHSIMDQETPAAAPAGGLDMAPDPAPHEENDLSAQKDVLLKAKATVESLLSDPDYPSLLSLVNRAKAVLIVPRLLKLSFFLGGHGGSAVLLARKANGKWSAPAFYTVGGINYGFQFGAQSSELILTIMSDKGLKAVLDRELTLGADAGVSVGTIGRGVHAASGLALDADVYAFSRSAGLYAGISLDGTVVTPDTGWDKAVYGPDATPDGILVEQKFSSPLADPLLKAMP